MFLLIYFEGETIPFVLEGSDADVLHAIGKAKELGYVFSEKHYVVEEDRIILHAFKKGKGPKKRFYCLKDQIILQTDCRCPDEVESTRSLLAYERNVPEEMISVIEV